MWKFQAEIAGKAGAIIDAAKTAAMKGASLPECVAAARKALGDWVPTYKGYAVLSEGARSKLVEALAELGHNLAVAERKAASKAA